MLAGSLMARFYCYGVVVRPRRIAMEEAIGEVQALRGGLIK